MHRLRCRQTPALLLLLLVWLPACSRSHHAPIESACGYLYTLRAPKRTIRLGGCAALLGMAPTDLALRRGQSFEMDSVTESSGTPDMKPPVPDDTNVVVLTKVFGHGGNGRYRAVGVGESTLRISSLVCNGGPVDSTATTRPRTPPPRVCPVVQVTVTS